MMMMLLSGQNRKETESHGSFFALKVFSLVPCYYLMPLMFIRERAFFPGYQPPKFFFFLDFSRLVLHTMKFANDTSFLEVSKTNNLTIMPEGRSSICWTQRLLLSKISPY